MTIKQLIEFCRKKKHCRNCPFDNYEDCFFLSFTPEEWDAEDIELKVKKEYRMICQFQKKPEVIWDVNPVFNEQDCIDSIVDAYRDVLQDDNYKITVTSARDGKHSKYSLHYSGEAIDLRTKDIKEQGLIPYIADLMAIMLKFSLPEYEWAVIDESDTKQHLHLQTSHKNVNMKRGRVYA